MSGDGQLLLKNGDRYDGCIERNNPNGFGKLTYGNGEVFEGHFENGRRHGRGMLTLSNGDVLTGKWLDDKHVRDDQLDFCAGVERREDISKCPKRNGRSHGRCLVTYRNGDTYDGKFRDGFKHGYGTCKLADNGSGVYYSAT